MRAYRRQQKHKPGKAKGSRRERHKLRIASALNTVAGVNNGGVAVATGEPANGGDGMADDLEYDEPGQGNAPEPVTVGGRWSSFEAFGRDVKARGGVLGTETRPAAPEGAQVPVQRPAEQHRHLRHGFTRDAFSVMTVGATFYVARFEALKAFRVWVDTHPEYLIDTLDAIMETRQDSDQGYRPAYTLKVVYQRPMLPAEAQQAEPVVKPTAPTPPEGQYICVHCGGLNGAPKRKGPSIPQFRLKACAYCGGEFVPNGSRQRFCREEHRHLFMAQKAHDKRGGQA